MVRWKFVGGVAMAAAFVILFVFWYVESFKGVFIERGIAKPQQIDFKSIRLDARHGLVIKYSIHDWPHVENTGHLIPWRSGYRSLSDDYLAQKRKQPPPPQQPYDATKSINANQLTGKFALENAPRFDELDDVKLKRVTTVIAELRRGYGGTLVVSPRDEVLDSPAFLAHYLRAFAIPDSTDAEGLSSYDYRFERILARVTGNDDTLGNAKLDWDVFRAFLLYEDFATNTGHFDWYRKVERGETFRHRLDSAKDLLWGYLEHNATAIASDRARLNWWIDVLTEDMKDSHGRPLRAWFLLLLAMSTDTETAALFDARETGSEDDRLMPVRRPNPYNVFLHAGGESSELGKQPPFVEAIKALATSQGLKYEVWALDIDKIPLSKAYQVDLAPRLSQLSPATIFGQESWSKTPSSFGVSFSSPVGRRSAHFNVSMPSERTDDGVFFFTYNARLFVWPKSQMDDAAIQMLQRAGLIDEDRRRQFQTNGFASLHVTLESSDQDDSRRK